MTYKIWIRTIVLCLPYVFLSMPRDDIYKEHALNTRQPEEKSVSCPIPASYCNEITIDSMPVELAAYYKYINLAARAIYDNYFEQASAFYDTAFLHKTNPFFEDLKNYILLNAKCGLFSKNDPTLHQLVIDKQVDTAQLFSSLPTRIFSKENIAVINKLVKAQKKSKREETLFHKLLREMFRIDQEIRDYEGISQKDYETRKAIYTRRDSVDKVNFVQFEKLYYQYGFPDEETVGVFYDNGHQWGEVVYILLRHFVQLEKKETTDRVLLIIQKAFYEGDLHPSIYATLMELIGNQPDTPRPGFNFMKTTMNLVMGEIYRPFVFYTDSLMQEVNTNRISIGLDSFHITQKQVVCQYLGSKDLEGKKFIKMVQYAQIDELPPGLVKMSCEAVNVDYHSYKINTAKIMDKCHCEEKVY